MGAEAHGLACSKPIPKAKREEVMCREIIRGM